MYFNDSEGQGVSLGSLATLANGDDLAFEVGACIGEKASIRFEVRATRDARESEMS